ncbi:hypothetical protein HKD37_15G043794 [Glycine soja]
MSLLLLLPHHILFLHLLLVSISLLVAKEEKVKATDDSLSEAVWLSEASSSFSGWETLEEDKLEICAPSAQPARLVRMLSLLTLSAPKLT